MKYASLCALFALAIPALAIDGTVINGTTGKPQPGVTITISGPTLAAPLTADGHCLDGAPAGKASRLVAIWQVLL